MMNTLKNKLVYANGWNWLFGALAVWIFVCGYAEGFWNAVNCLIMVLAFFMIGRASLDRELEIALDKAKEQIAKNG